MDKNVNSTRAYSYTQSKMSYLGNYYKWIYKKIAHGLHGNVLDLGSGSGHMLEWYLQNQHVKKVTAVDLDPACIDFVKKKNTTALSENRLDAKVADIFEFINDTDAKFDCIVLMDILEHIDDNRFLQMITKILTPNGKLFIKVPAGSKLYCDIDRESGHFRRYDYKDLRTVLEKNGFNISYIGYMNPIGRVAYWYKSKKVRKTTFSESFPVTFLKLANAFLSVLSYFDFFKLPGLSLVAVVERKATL